MVGMKCIKNKEITMLKNNIWGFILFSLLLFSGCSPFRGFIYTDVGEPGAVVIDRGFLFLPGNVKNMANYVVDSGKGSGSKVGNGSVINILGLFAFGDASVENITRNVEISEIYTIDSHFTNFLYIYRKWSINVTGE